LKISENGLVLDSCVLINLLCSNYLKSFFEIYEDVVLAEFVLNKEIFPINEKYSYEESALEGRILKPNEEEAELILDLINEIDDGEAYSISLALSRGYDFGSDDKKAIRVYQSYPEHKKLWTTPEIVLNFLENSELPIDKKQVLQSIQEKGKFSPNSNHPYHYEWNKILKEGYIE